MLGGRTVLLCLGHVWGWTKRQNYDTNAFSFRQVEFDGSMGQSGEQDCKHQTKRMWQETLVH